MCGGRLKIEAEEYRWVSDVRMESGTGMGCDARGWIPVTTTTAHRSPPNSQRSKRPTAKKQGRGHTKQERRQGKR